MATLSTISIKLDADTMGFGRRLDAARTDVMNFGQKVPAATNSLSSLAAQFGFAGGAAGIAFTAVNRLSDAMMNLATSSARAGVEYARFSLSAASEFQNARIGMEAILGSAQAAEEMVSDLRKFAAESPLEFQGLSQNATTLLAYGMAGEQVLPTLKMLGDVSLGNSDRMRQLTLAFGQASAAGKLTGQDLLQFIAAGFNPLQKMAQRTGEDYSVLLDKMSEGQITFDMVAEEFRLATAEGTSLGEAMEKMANSHSAAVSKVMDANKDLAASFGEALLPSAQKGLGEIESKLKALKIGAEAAKPVFASSMDAITDSLTRNSDAIGTWVGQVQKFAVQSTLGNTGSMVVGATDAAVSNAMESAMRAAHNARAGERFDEQSKRAAEAANAAKKKAEADEAAKKAKEAADAMKKAKEEQDRRDKEAKDQQKALRDAQKQMMQLSRSAERFGRGIGRGIEGGLKDVVKFLDRKDVRELVDIGPAAAMDRGSLPAVQAIHAAQRAESKDKPQIKVAQEQLAVSRQILRALEKGVLPLRPSNITGH